MTKRFSSEDEEHGKIMTRLAGVMALLRRQERLSLRELAAKIGVSHSDLFRLETGKTRDPSIFLIRKVAQGFGMTVDEFMNFDAETCPTCGGSGWVRRGNSNQEPE